MRRGPVSSVRVATVCARCGQRPDRYDVRRVTAFLPQRHDLVVCRHCDQFRQTSPTIMETHAITIDITDAVRCMEFTQRWGADVTRVQRTAEFFLGAELCDATRAQALAEEESSAEEWETNKGEESWSFFPDEDDYGV